jgi:hypothetical protein
VSSRPRPTVTIWPMESRYLVQSMCSILASGGTFELDATGLSKGPRGHVGTVLLLLPPPGTVELVRKESGEGHLRVWILDRNRPIASVDDDLSTDAKWLIDTVFDRYDDPDQVPAPFTPEPLPLPEVETPHPPNWHDRLWEIPLAGLPDHQI